MLHERIHVMLGILGKKEEKKRKRQCNEPSSDYNNPLPPHVKKCF